MEYLNIHPWGTGKYDLSEKCLSVDEKSWLANAHVDHGVPYSLLTEHFAIRNRTLRKYVILKRNMISYREKVGRPRVLNKISEEELLNWTLRESHFRESEIKDLIKSEAKRSFERSFQGLIPQCRKNKRYISYRSLMTYVAYFKNIHNNNMLSGN